MNEDLYQEVHNIWVQYIENKKSYVLQLNDQYFLVPEEHFKAICSLLTLPDNIGLSIG